MRRRTKILAVTGACFLGLALAAVLVLRSEWFSSQARERFARAVELATGGRVEIGSFHLGWSTMRIDLGDLVIHGSEPANELPLLRVASITLTLRFVSLLERAVDIEALDILRPRLHLIIDERGETNIPGPTAGSGRPVLDVAIKRFTVQEGALDINSSRNPWSASGKNLRAVFNQEPGPKYQGVISIQPLDLVLSHNLPVALRVNAACTVGKNRVDFSSVTLETPESRADLCGAVTNLKSPETVFQYRVRLSLGEVSRTLKLHMPQSGAIEMAGDGNFKSAANYLLTGRLHAPDLAFGQPGRGLRNVRVDSAIRVDGGKIELPGLRMAVLGGAFNGRGEITGLDRYRLDGEVVGLDLQRLVGAAGSRPAPWNGVLSGSIDVRGLLSELSQMRFNAHLRAVISPAAGSAPVRGAIDASYDGGRGVLDLADSYLALPSTQLAFSGALGRQLRLRLKSTNLNDLAPALDGPLPVTLDGGSAAFDGTITGSMEKPQIAGRVSLENFVYAKEKFDTFSGDVTVDESSARLQHSSLKRGALALQVEGTAGLKKWQLDHAASLAVKTSMRGPSLREFAALAGRKSFPVEGALVANATVSGSIDEPRIQADLSLTKGSIFEEPFDRLSARVTDGGQHQLQVEAGEIQMGAQRLRFDASYDYTPGDFANGRATLHAASDRISLDHMQTMQKRWPGLAGWLQFTAGGTVSVAPSPSGAIEFRLTDLTANATGHQVEVDRKPMGDIRFTAATKNAELEARFEMAIAGSNLQGEGHWRLEGDYPGTVQASFSKLDFATLLTWWQVPEWWQRTSGWMQGTFSLAGPALKPSAWTGRLELAKFEISPARSTSEPASLGLALSNAGPIRLALTGTQVRVEDARLVGRNTNISVTGTATFSEPDALDLHATGAMDLAVLQDFNPGLAGSGRVTTDAVIRGRLRQPQITGRLELKDAGLTVAEFPNGLSNINGSVLFEGTRATLQNLTAETGGGKVTLSGFAFVSAGEPTFHIDANASQVRLRYPEGASTVADAALTLTGSTARSVLSGTVTILRTGLNRRTDFSSLFARSAEPVRAAANPAGLLGGMQFDVQIETAPGTSFQTSLAQNLQAEANLRLRGTISNPVLLGRINITQGEMTFFGNKYTIGQETIDFYNPVRLEPNLNIDLQTRARGIDITLTVSGPITKLNVNYRSDPPLQFSDIVALLATGRAPASDPLARQSGAAQAWQQAGASALVAQAVSSGGGGGRLERFFGVSKIKIDPMLTGVDNNPQARLTIEQPVTQNVTLTYITNLTRTNSEFVRLEWSMNREWSVIAIREENSAFGLDIQYRKRFK